MAEALVRRFHPLHIAQQADTGLPGGQVSAFHVVEDTASGRVQTRLAGAFPSIDSPVMRVQ